jgi:hypothetical protein
MTLDSDHIAFMQSGVVIDVAGRDGRNVPTVARAVGCRVSADAQRATLFMPRAPAARLLASVAENGAIAAVFCLASTLRTMQVKGSDATAVPVSDDDVASVRAAVAAFVADVVSLGFSEAQGLADASYNPADLAGVAFTVAAAFVQTPGPAAGARI